MPRLKIGLVGGAPVLPIYLLETIEEIFDDAAWCLNISSFVFLELLHVGTAGAFCSGPRAVMEWNGKYYKTFKICIQLWLHSKACAV